MQTPEKDKIMKTPTAVLITDSVHAKIFFANNDEFRHLTDVEVDTTFEKGGEGHAPSQPGMIGTPIDDSDRMHWEGSNMGRLFSQIDEVLKTMLQKGEVKEVILVVPETHKNQLAEKLSHDVSEHVVRTVTKNLINHPIDQILSTLEG